MQISHVPFMQISYVLMQCMMTADRNAETLVRDHYYWMGMLTMLVSKGTIKII